MKKIIEKIKESHLEGINLALALTIALLSGVIIGMLCSVKGNRFYGCYNGCNVPVDELEEDDCDNESNCL